MISGASNETAKALLTTHLLSFEPRKALMVTENNERAESLAQWCGFFERTALHLEPILNAAGEIVPEHLQLFLQFLQPSKKNDEQPIFVATRSTWDTPFPRYRELTEKSITLEKGKKVNFTELVELFIERGYSHGEDIYLQPGQYRRIGDVLDLYPIQSGHPFRILFDFDLVAQIISVDRDDLSKTEDAGKELQIFPVRYATEEPLSEQFPSDALLVMDDQNDAALPKDSAHISFTAFPESQVHHVHLRYLSVLKFYTVTDFLNDVRDKLQQ